MIEKIIPESRLGKIIENPWIPEKTRKNLLLYNLTEQGERKDIMKEDRSYQGRAIKSPDEFDLAKKLESGGLVRLDMNLNQKMTTIAITDKGVEELDSYNPKEDLSYLEKPFLRRLEAGLRIKTEKGIDFFKRYISR